MLHPTVPATFLIVNPSGSLHVKTSAERGVPLVQVYRGARLESVHHVAACVAAATGEVLYALGDINEPYPVRSLAKPFLGVELIRTGAAHAFHFTATEIAIACGSHDGERCHTESIRAMLMKIGEPVQALLCGPATEGSVTVGPPIANNCSGKHVAVLALCKHLGFETARYMDPDHPVQRWLLPRLENAFAVDHSQEPLIDGCGLPIFCANLRLVALAYAAFGADSEHVVFRVRAAMAAHPELVGGTRNNLDTQILRITDGAVIGKIGAEGLHGDAVPTAGLGIAIKILDGNSRALGPVVVALLRRFAPLASSLDDHLSILASTNLRNSAGTLVGSIRVLPLP